MSNKQSLPIGCVIPILAIIFIATYFSVRETPKEIKKQEAEHDVYIKKYDYNPDSLARNVSRELSYTNQIDIDNSTAHPTNYDFGKVLILEQYSDGLAFVPEARITPMIADKLTAYNINDLKTLIVLKHTDENINKLGAHGEVQEGCILKFFDYKTNKLIYTKTILGSWRYESKSRRGSTTNYKLTSSQLANEITQVIQRDIN